MATETELGFADLVYLVPVSLGLVVVGSNCIHLLEPDMDIDQPYHIVVEHMGKIVDRNVHSMA